jgi:septum formation protein
VTSNKRLILASASPRRRELMKLLGVPFEVRVSAVEERRQAGEVLAKVPQRFSRLKAEHVAREVSGGIVIAADTVVIHEGEILGKPRDADHARAMLRRLRGECHLVLSGVTVMEAATGRRITELCESKVWMRPMDEAEIEAYVATGDPLDKAAAYAIQNAEFAPVVRVVGCPTNVMGLPMCHVVRDLRRLGVTLPPTLPTRCEIHYGYTCALVEYVMPCLA